MDRFLVYTKERFGIFSHLVLITAFALPAFKTGSAFLVFVGLFLFFFQLRAMDEFKDYDKDCIAHPNRPLPRGLITPTQMRTLIHCLLLIMIAFSGIVWTAHSLTAAATYALVTAYLWAMFHEFKAKVFLSSRPLHYAITHQLILFPLTAFLIAIYAQECLFSPTTPLIALVLLGGFFAYELCRKLNPKAHPILSTYPQVYGRKRTALFVTITLLISACAELLLGIWLFLWGWHLLLFAAVIWYLFDPSKYKTAEVVASISLIAHITSLWMVLCY